MVGLTYRIVSPLYSGIRADLNWAMAVPREMVVMIDVIELAVTASSVVFLDDEFVATSEGW